MDCFELVKLRAAEGLCRVKGATTRGMLEKKRAAHFIVLMEVIFSVTTGPE